MTKPINPDALLELAGRCVNSGWPIILIAGAILALPLGQPLAAGMLLLGFEVGKATLATKEPTNEQ